MLLAQDAFRRLGSVGKVIPTVAARVVDDEMNDVPVGQVGEIVYRAPTLMAGYWNNPEATAEAFAGGWFHSGDLVRQDEEGYVWVVDRKKDMIISGGENIYCAEVENEKWGEVPFAVVAVAGTGIGLADLDEFLSERLARYKHPKALEIVDALPRNPAGKVLKTELRARYGGENQIDAGESSAPPTLSAAAQDNHRSGATLLTVTGSIRPMQCNAAISSGTVLWSVLLPASRETAATHTGLGQGGGVRQGLPLRHGRCDFVVGARR